MQDPTHQDSALVQVVQQAHQVVAGSHLLRGDEEYLDTGRRGSQPVHDAALLIPANTATQVAAVDACLCEVEHLVPSAPA